MAHCARLPVEEGLLGEAGGRGLAWLVSQLRVGFYFGKLAVGDRLPSVRGLAKQLHVSPTTALDLYKKLEAQGFVEGRQRSGTFLRRVGTETVREGREAALFNLLSVTAKKLGLMRVSPLEFAHAFLRYTGASPRDDFKFGFVSYLESFEMVDRDLQRRLRFRLPIVPLSPEPARQRDMRALIAQDRSIRCLLTTYLHTTVACELAAEFNLPLIMMRLGSPTARIFELPSAGNRYIVMRDADCAEGSRRLAGIVLGPEQARRIRVVALSETERLAEVERDANEVYASPTCEHRVRVLFGSTKTVMSLPTEMSQQTVDDILFHYVFANLDREGHAGQAFH